MHIDIEMDRGGKVRRFGCFAARADEDLIKLRLLFFSIVADEEF
jgi:hypothetical protein